MSPADLPLSLEAGSVIRELGAGEVLFEQGDRAAAIYKVESGRLRLVRRTVDDHLVILHTACRREFFAEASLFAATYHCDAVAAEPSRIRVYPKAKVMEALRTDPVLAPAFMARLAHPISFRNFGQGWSCAASARPGSTSFNTCDSAPTWTAAVSPSRASFSTLRRRSG